MSLGTREVAGDFYGGSFVGDSDSFDSFVHRVARKHRRKKAKSRRKVSKRRKHVRAPKHSRKSRKHRTKRKGMSAAFLKNLRRKHGLGEFKKR